MTQTQAYDLLPANAEWSCSFGNPGEGGFNEFYRTPDGKRWIISNGSYGLFAPEWNCQQG